MLKGMSLEIPIGKVDTVVRVENNINIFVKREYVGFPGVGDHRMLHIDIMGKGDGSSVTLIDIESNPLSNNGD